ncbi:hypothetical protein DPMN_009046 [Dreissena polymorpha]|uniref:SRCR domain-containing protein n=1 Tax=Dreissena polymorpha TaxID=45954 RepID=A0A9D4RZS7_DREPO|nr:hypothetical protein DPMN_009046 [Dreissena polymorpha]
MWLTETRRCIGYYFRYNSTEANGFIGNLQCSSNTSDELVVMALNISSISLFVGSSVRDGRVEVRIENTAGTICQDNFDLKDAQVICKMIGFNAASSFYADYHYNTTGRLPMIRDIQCSGQESHLNNCTYITLYNGYTCVDGAVALVCTDCGPVNVSNGQIASYNDASRTLTIRYHNDIDNPAYIQYICGNDGIWNKTAEYDSDPCARSTLNCTQTSGCTLDRDNEPTCFCNAGFTFNKTAGQCQAAYRDNSW